MENPQPSLILASASPRRRQLLEQIGVDCIVAPVDIDETPRTGEALIPYVERMALEKATAAREIHGESPILAADTAGAVGDTLLVKPRDFADARTMLESMSGRSHIVVSSVCLFADCPRLATSVTEVLFRPISRAEIEAYWASGEPADKAGAYAIQGLGALFVESIKGSYSGVVGMPLCETAELLRAAGIAVLTAKS